jgi:hypothetical protein
MPAQVALFHPNKKLLDREGKPIDETADSQRRYRSAAE